MIGWKITSKEREHIFQRHGTCISELYIYRRQISERPKFSTEGQNLLHSMIVGNELSPLVCVKRHICELLCTEQSKIIEQGVVPFD